MPHIDPDRIALLAMGEPVISAEESDHLADCAECVDDLTALRHAALAGRASFDVGDIESPPDGVWDRISSELSLSAVVATPASHDSLPGRSLTEVATVARTDDAPAAPVEASEVAAPSVPAPVVVKKTRVLWRLWALAAAFALVAGAGLGVWSLNQRTALTDIAEASLAAFPSHVGAEGIAVVEESDDGSLAVRVKLSADAAPDTYREVWLITADASALVSLGVLDGSQATFPVPEGVDLRDYVLVDISQEPDDGDSNHSGDSIVRGELSFL